MTLQEIIDCVNHLSKEDIRIKSRERNIVILRNIYFKIAREQTQIAFSKIAKAVGKDHATVMHSIKRIEIQLTWDNWNEFYKLCLDTLENNVTIEDSKASVVIKYIDRIVEIPAKEVKTT